MNGLLGDPRLLGLLGAAGGLLQAGGPSRMPVGFGQALGQGIMGGVGAAQQAQQGQLMNQMQTAQLEEMKRKAALSQQQQGFLDQFASTLPPDQQAAFRVSPEAFIKDRLSAFTLKPGDTRFDSSGKPIASAPQDASGGAPVTPTTIVGQDGKPQIIDARTGRVIGTPWTEKPSSPFFSPVSTPNGLMAFDARTGTLTPLNLGGAPVMKASDSPAHQGAITEAKTGAKERTEARVAAQVDLPRVVDNANNSIQIVDQMLKHPGFKTSVGAGLGGVARHIPGSQAAGFHALLDQVKGGAFLEAFNSLKGGGQITEVEGKKATDAITRMQTATKEVDFIKAAREYQDIIRKGVERAQIKAGGTVYNLGGGTMGPKPRDVPSGVDPKLWGVMTPEERALWAN